MATVEGLSKVQGLIDQSNASLDGQLRQQAAAQASDLFKQGDIKGALSTLAKVDPDHAASMIAQFQQFDPASQQALHQAQAQGMTQGQFNVTTPAGANPRQLLDAQLAGQKEIAAMKAAQPKPSDTVVRNDPNSPTGFSLINKKTGAKVDANQPQLPQSNDPAEKAPKLRPNEDVDSNGDVVMLTPNQQKVIKETRKTFDSETKDLVKGIDAATKSIDYINTNTPGSKTIEALTTLKGAIGGRVGQQEFQAYGKGMGVITQINEAISEAEGKGMSPQVQKNMAAIAATAQDVLTKEYDQHLKNAVERNPEVDPLILKKRLAGSGPTIHQAIVNHISSLPPEDQAAFNWAHDNPTDPRSKAILQKLMPSK